jgi:putative copper resistance protein D
VAIGCYLVLVRRAFPGHPSGRGFPGYSPENHRHSERWPLSRTTSWIAGWLVVCAATNLQLARFGDHTFLLVEKVQHVAIVVVAPVLLVGGGGVALAMRALAPSADHGPREWLGAALSSRAMLAVSHPAASLGLYAAALYGIYASALYTVSLRSHAGHLASFAAALLIGTLLYWPLLGVQPAARALPHQSRLAQLGAATLLQLLFGLALARTTPLSEYTPLWLVASGLLVAAVWTLYRTTPTPGTNRNVREGGL